MAAILASGKAVAVVDAELRIRYASRAFRRIVGVGARSLRGRRLERLGGAWSDPEVLGRLHGMAQGRDGGRTRVVEWGGTDGGGPCRVVARRVGRPSLGGPWLVLALRGAGRGPGRSEDGHFREVAESTFDWELWAGPEGRLRWVNPAVERHTGYTVAECLATEDFLATLIHPEDRDAVAAAWDRARGGSTGEALEFRVRHKDGSLRWMELAWQPFAAGGRSLGFRASIRDISRRKEADRAFRECYLELERRVAERTDALQRANRALRESESVLRSFYDSSPMLMGVVEVEGDDIRLISANAATARLLGESAGSLGGRLVSQVGGGWRGLDRWVEKYRECARSGRPVHFEYADEYGGRPVWLSATIGPVASAPGPTPRFAYVVEDVTERKRAEERQGASERRFELATRATNDAIWEWDLRTGSVWWNEGLETLYGYPLASVGPGAAWWEERVHPEERREVVEGLAAAIAGGDATWTSEYRFLRADGTYAPTFDRGFIERDPRGEPVRVIGSMMDLTERKRAEQEIRDLNARLERRLARIAALRRIDEAIAAGLEVGPMLEVALEQAQGQLDVDAAAVLTFDEDGRGLTCVASRGLSTEAMRRARVPAGASLPGMVAATRRAAHIADLGGYDGPIARAAEFEAEGIVAYHAVPLVAKGRPLGVLEVYHRAPRDGDAEWRECLEALGDQVAIGVESAALRARLERTNAELAAAYDATIEGWARALDLRDHETEGHSRRVTDLSVRLARALGLGEEELAHVRRGALLHDIGKMGVPDSILHKPGPLTEVEWEVMRRHPTLAVEMLGPIAYLLPALEIPLCHHERWDGTGYPRGLAGEAIPLSARIFAAVDIWDALRSDRPYRAAWPDEKVRAHLASLSGTHLDPRVVSAFLRLLESDDAGGTREAEAPADASAPGGGGARPSPEPTRAAAPSEPAARVLIEHVTDLLTVLDADGTIRWEGASLGATLGYRPEEVVGRSGFELVHPDDLHAAHAVLAEVLARPGAEGRLRARIRHRDGSWRHLEIVGKNLMDHPDVRGVLLSSRDVTETARAEDALRRSEALLQSVIDHCPAAVKVKDTLGRYLLVSRTCEPILGVPGGLALGRTDAEIAPAEQAAARRATDRAALAAAGHVEYEERIELADGPHTFFTVKFPLLGRDGLPYAVGSVSTDITARKTLEARLAEQLQLAHDLNARLEEQHRDLERVNARLAELAETDALTGLKNRRSWMAAMESALASASRRGLPASLVLLDLDGFRRINDAFGHPAGDAILRGVAEELTRRARDRDVVARLGGEEFAVVLFDTTAREALAIAESLRAAIAGRRWRHGPVTASFGVATAAPGRADAEALIRQADQALYQAKRDGKDCVRPYREAPALAVVGAG